jgi:hypothetical protein
MKLVKVLTVGILIICIAAFLTREYFHTKKYAEPEIDESIKSLPYAKWTNISEDTLGKSGVTYHDSDRAYQGINVYCSEKTKTGYFIDMEGNRLHNLSTDYANCKLLQRYKEHWLMLVQVDKGILKLDWDSRGDWFVKGRFHHDFAISNNDEIYALMNENANFSEINPNELITDNLVGIITPNGTIRRQISFAKMILKVPELLNLAKNQSNKYYIYDKHAWDVFHTNAITIIDRDLSPDSNQPISKSKLIKKGNILFSMASINLVGVFDIDKEEIIWHWGPGNIEFPHNPQILDNGNILVFDNGKYRKYSRVIEVDPFTQEIEWEYKANPPVSFFTETQGSAQRLTNGNTLIVESAKGHVFEVTREGETVWDFWIPEVKNAQRETIYRMNRYPLGAISQPDLKRQFH